MQIGTIMGMKRNDENKLIMEVLVEQDEALHLQGHTNNVRLIAEDVVNVPSRVSLRGKNEGTKYFLIPRSLRKNWDLKNNTVNCRKMSFDDRMLFVFTVREEAR